MPHFLRLQLAAIGTSTRTGDNKKGEKGMPTVKQYLNIPETFEIKINQKIKVSVESLAPAWITLILQRLGEMRSKRDKPFLAEIIEKAVKDKKLGEDVIMAIYDKANDEALTIGEFDFDQEELEIIRLMTIPNHKWKECRGNFEDYEFSFSIDDMRESFTELQLMKIYDEFWQRNPRFDRKKKMMNPGAMTTE